MELSRMGADLYIDKHDTGFDEEAGGYFRDSYNVTNILNRLGLSYWQLERDIPTIGKIPWHMKLKQVKILLAEVIKRKAVLDKFLAEELSEAWLEKHYAALGDDGIEGWRKYYAERYEKLVKFLKHAVELKSTIRWSV